MTIKRIFVFLHLLFATSAYASHSKINSANIIKSTLSALPSCLHYQVPTHVCIWVSQWGEVNTTPIVSHYLPDLVVSVFKTPDDNPWLEVGKVAGNAEKTLQNEMVRQITGVTADGGNHSLQDQHEQEVIFKEAEIIGNPALMMIPIEGLLPSTASAWQIYFESTVDSLLWRGLSAAALPEEGMAITFNATHHIGTELSNWGGIYPHEGKVIQDNDVKASAVIAARAADLVTSQQGYGHIYNALSDSCGEHCSAAKVQTNSKQTYFQMIYPIAQTECHILGDSGSYQASMLNHDSAYVWVVWRQYEGCVDGDGKYSGRT